MNAEQIAEIIHSGIRDVFTQRGGTAEQWQRVAASPAKFNRVWRKVLGIEDATTPPPPGLRTTDPRTGEILREDPPHEAVEVRAGSTAPALRHVACTWCDNWRDGCRAGFEPSMPTWPAHLCGRFAPLQLEGR